MFLKVYTIAGHVFTQSERFNAQLKVNFWSNVSSLQEQVRNASLALKNLQ